MKTIIFAVSITLCALNAKGQTTDSTTIHLQQYKQWYDSGLINQREYEALKTKTLNLNQPIAREHNKWNNLGTLKRIYTISFVGGGALEVLGVFSFIDAYKWDEPSAFLVAQYGEDKAKRYERRELIAAGSLGLGAGTAYLIVGSIAYYKYKELKIKLAPTGGGVSMNF